MITLKSNIEYLKDLKEFLSYENFIVKPHDLSLLQNNLDYAIEILKMVETLNIDTWDEGICKICDKDMNKVTECAWSSCPKWLDEWDEERQDIIGQNGNIGYE